MSEVVKFLVMDFGAIFCILLGILIHKRYMKHKSIGTLLIDVTDPKTDIFRFSLEIDPEELKKKKQIILKVDTSARFSQDKQPL